MNQTATPVLRVAVVDDQPLYRAMLARTLAANPRLGVVAAVGTVAEARAAVAAKPVDVVVLDIDLPDGNGIALGVQLRRAHARIGIVLLSAHDAMDLLLDLPKDVSHGWGYLSKTSSTSEALLYDAVFAAARGQTVLDPALLAGMRPRRGSDVSRLTDRQFDVLRLLAQGLSNVGIGERLNITEKSVQNHVNAIYAALGIDARREHNPRVQAALRLLEGTGPA